MDDPQIVMEMTVVKEEIKGEPDDSMENDGKNGLWDVPPQPGDMAFAVVNEENDSEEEDVKPPLTVFLSPEQQQDEYLQEKDPLALDALGKDIPVDNKSLMKQETESLIEEKKINEIVMDKSYPTNKVRSPAEKILGVDCDLRPELQVKEMEKNEEAFECKICNKLLASRSGLICHIHIHKGEKSYESADVRLWLEALKDHTDHTRLKCPVCGCCCVGRTGLYVHMRVHRVEKPYECTYCGMGFATESSLNMHTRTHGGEGSYKCNFCEKEFKYLPHLTEHLEIVHTGERLKDMRDEAARNEEAFECKICNKLLSSRSGLMCHIHIHKGEKSYESSIVRSWLQSLKNSTSYHTQLNCPVCGRYCAGKTGLNIHMKIHTTQKPYKCKDCGMEFSTEYSLNRHKRTHPGGSYKCSICEKEFKSLPHFSEHIEITHTGEIPYACSTCGKRFSREKNLVTHSESHSGDRPFDSSSCGKRYPPESGLVAHNSIHSGERPYQCKYCEKCFEDQYLLNKHWKMHAEERPFKCIICQKKYKDLGNLSKHMRVHTGDGEYTCGICRRRFWYKRNLIFHNRIHTV